MQSSRERPWKLSTLRRSRLKVIRHLAELSIQKVALSDAAAGHLRLPAHLLAMTLLFMDLPSILGAEHIPSSPCTSTRQAPINNSLCLNQGRIHGTGDLGLQSSDSPYPLPHSKWRFKQRHAPLQVLQAIGPCMQAPRVARLEYQGIYMQPSGRKQPGAQVSKRIMPRLPGKMDPIMPASSVAKAFCWFSCLREQYRPRS